MDGGSSMTIEKKDQHVEVIAEHGKRIMVGDRAVRIGSFPVDYDLSTIEEVDETITEEGEDEYE